MDSTIKESISDVIILCGGEGKRLYPISSEKFPKQFVKIDNEGNTLFYLTLLRAYKILPEYSNIVIVTLKKFKKQVQKDIEKLKQNEIYSESLNKQIHIIYEPEKKNTLPAVSFAVSYISHLELSSERNILVLSSDHCIKDDNSFQISVEEAAKYSKKGSFVLFAKSPEYASTRYGWLFGKRKTLDGICFDVEKFKEKPNKKDAEKFLDQDNSFWNCGIFCFTNTTFQKELKKANKKYLFSNKLFDNQGDLEKYYSKLESLSIDDGLVSYIKNLKAVRILSDWQDVGNLEAFSKLTTPYKFEQIKCKDNICFSDKGKKIMVFGIDNLMVINGEEGIVVLPKDKLQEYEDFIKYY